MGINGKTVSLGVVGCPVEHSLSPLLHNTMANLTGLDYTYCAYRVEKGEMENALIGMKALNIRGLNVTIPHKTEAFRLADEVDGAAKRMGACNTLVNENGKIKGYNTDGEGFIRSLKREGVDVKGKICVIIGAGGAAMGVAMALAESGAKEIEIKNRTADKADALCGRINKYYPKKAKRVEDVYDADILINATSVGMNSDLSPIDDMRVFKRLKKSAVAADIVYCPRNTMFLKMAGSVGLKCVGGIGMLIYQAVAAFERFTGKRVDETIVDALYAMTAMKKNIVLTGFMGTGKSAVGREIAARVGMRFIDTDDCIEREHGKITDIFKEKGEKYFRDIESETIKRAAKEQGAVISLGGGAVLQKENIDILRQNGFVVRLKADIDRVYKNIGDNTDSRPLLSGKTKDEAAKLLEEREPFYQNCDAAIDVTDAEKEESAGAILDMYYEHCLGEALE